jgi:hypothetical protein
MHGVGLLALLLGVGLMFYLMFGAGGKGSAGQALEAQQQAQSVGNQLSGKDESGKLVTQSIKFEAGLKGIAVSEVTPGSPFDTLYGLKAGDVITEIGPLDAKTQAADNSTADAFLRTAYAQAQTLTVQRDGQRLTLPQPAAPGTATPAPQRTTPRNQLEGILKGRSEDAVPKH